MGSVGYDGADGLIGLKGDTGNIGMSSETWNLILHLLVANYQS